MCKAFFNLLGVVANWSSLSLKYFWLLMMRLTRLACFGRLAVSSHPKFVEPTKRLSLMYNFEKLLVDNGRLNTI